MRKVYVVGVGMTSIGRHYKRSMRDLFAEATLQAIDDAKGEKPQALVVGNMLSSSMGEQDSLGALLADSAGLRGIPAFKVEAACGSGGAAFFAAYNMVASGMFDVVLVAGVEKMTEHITATVTRALAQAADAEYELFYGASFTGLNALLMRYYMEKYRVSREEMAAWPVLMHENASQNPFAQLRFKITVEQVLNAMVVADPITLLDSSPMGDGAAAVMIASEEVARKLTDTPVRVAGVGLATDSVDLSTRLELDDLAAARLAAEKAYRMAGVEAGDIDVAEVHDAFTITGLLSLEALGLAGRGEAAKLVAEGRFRPGDRPEVNLSGGLKARGHPVGATGVYQIAEIAMQLRGDFPGVKASNPEVGLAENIGGHGATISVVVLRR